MTDMDLLDFMVRQYQTQGKMAQSLKLSEGAISKWRSRGELPKAWKMYFMAQFEKMGATEIAGTDLIRVYFDNPLSNFAKLAQSNKVNDAFNAFERYRSKGAQNV